MSDVCRWSENGMGGEEGRMAADGVVDVEEGGMAGDEAG